MGFVTVAFAVNTVSTAFPWRALLPLRGHKFLASVSDAKCGGCSLKAEVISKLVTEVFSPANFSPDLTESSFNSHVFVSRCTM